MRFRTRTFSGNPFLVFGPRVIQERRIRAFILREHRAGRPIDEILQDQRLRRLAGKSLAWRAFVNPATISALRQDTNDEIRSLIKSIETSRR